MQDYKKLKVWQQAHQFVLTIYKISGSFPDSERYGLQNQLRRSAYSIPANIAEGCGKNSGAELAHFLNTSLGSANEVDYYLLLINDLGYINAEEYVNLNAGINEIKAMLITLIQKVRLNKKT
ncbi:MAG: four helix bundle protein [Chitinophagaceae bacterium]|nr:four helix bundle protein [Chitinophagaceae bacterium]